MGSNPTPPAMSLKDFLQPQVPEENGLTIRLMLMKALRTNNIPRAGQLVAGLAESATEKDENIVGLIKDTITHYPEYRMTIGHAIKRAVQLLEERDYPNQC